ncbi:MAG TPA: DegT/DnrJ/EryC1/StrS family aminotransferase [Phycisphaerales bacterium]|nr:DegT/DnrJ/EryC1/StrS family aminotransferase [Phycisphaerales bacterium]
MQVPLLDLVSQYATIKEDIMAAISEVLDSQRCIGGPKIEQLEKEIAAVSDCKFAVGASSGTDAILSVLMSLDIGAGDEVITTPFTFFATAGCIARCGAKPVFVDIDPGTYNIDPALIEAAITDRTRAIMPIHLYGQMADMDPIMAIAGANSLAVIEDACQSITSTYKDRKAGSVGTAGCLSFFPSKNLGGIGDGGMVVTNDEKLYDQLILMRNHGCEQMYYHKKIGGNFRLDPIQAAALLVKLPLLDKWSAGRRKNAEYYNKKFKGSVVVPPVVREDCVSIYNQYIIRVPKRDELLAHLRANDIGCAIYYPVPLHLQECFGDLGYKKGDMPHAEKAAEEVIALPVYPELTNKMQDYVVETALSFLQE